MTLMDVAARLEELESHGAALLRQVLPADSLAAIRRAACAAFAAMETGAAPALAAQYQFTPFSHSFQLPALLHFGCGSEDPLLAPLAAPGLGDLLARAAGSSLFCDPKHSWVRKRYAPRQAPPHYHPNIWHQDGGLGVDFQLGAAAAMTRLITCWFPLDPCDGDRPGLEVLREHLDALVPYTELDDVLLRRRFDAGSFWTPEMEAGDALVLLPGTLHRTHAASHMRQNRLSVEYRLFPNAGNRVDAAR
jgi:hypothetical protein